MKDAIHCFTCGTLIGYMVYCGPTGICYCPSCSEKEDEDNREQDEEDGFKELGNPSWL